MCWAFLPPGKTDGPIHFRWKQSSRGAASSFYSPTSRVNAQHFADGPDSSRRERKALPVSDQLDYTAIIRQLNGGEIDDWPERGRPTSLEQVNNVPVDKDGVRSSSSRNNREAAGARQPEFLIKCSKASSSLDALRTPFVIVCLHYAFGDWLLDLIRRCTSPQYCILGPDAKGRRNKRSEGNWL